MFLGYNYRIMLKRLTVLGIALIFLNPAWPQVVGDGGKKNQHSESGKSQSSAASPQCTCVVQVQPAPTKQAEDSKSKSYQWRELYAPANIPNWLLAVVGSLAVVAALKTLWAIRKQADLMDRQIAIQTTAMSQWVNIVPLGISKGVVPNGSGICEVSLQFEILNKTDYLMTILHIETNVRTNVHSHTRTVT